MDIKNFKLRFHYEADGQKHEESALENRHYKIEYSAKDDRIECNIVSKTPILPKKFEISYEKSFADDEVFYSNGYQAWTTSREYRACDTQRGVSPIAEIHPKLKALASISGDYLFADYERTAGVFHGFTYCYFRKGKHVGLFGSLSEQEGFTVFKCDFGADVFCIEKDIDGAIVDGRYKVFEIAALAGEYDGVFDEYFSLWNMKPRIKRLAGYTSWYNYFQNIDENIILRDLRGLKKSGANANIFQIDDGYETFVGDWLDPNPKKFPNGMGFIAEKIHGEGYLAGLWLAPFSAQKKSRLAAAHPDWLLRDEKTGKPILSVVAWGGAYTLDIYNAEAREYLKRVFDAVLNEWKFDMVKLDFLYSQCMRPRNGLTRGRIMRDAVEFLRECVKDKLILGCGVPLGAAFGLVDACRTGCDADLSYRAKIYNLLHVNEEIISTQNSINNTVFRRHLNGAIFCGDPDVFFLRKENLRFSEEQKLLLARINNLLGGVLFISDDAGVYDENQLKTLRAAFKKTDVKILSAEYTSKDDIRIEFTENGKEKFLEFNIKTGKATDGSALNFEE
ncbi:MAG: alpha-galactosidase [Clostridiales bacterium]|nr:alpha-galactosidase [Clostridiales bacterium]